MKEKIRWGIVGLGNIAQKFVDDLKLVADGELTAVASRDIEKAKHFGALNNAKYAFGSYNELFNCEAVDVVYIATPHTSHAELSIEAMKQGRNVLCENAKYGRIRKSNNEYLFFMVHRFWLGKGKLKIMI